VIIDADCHISSAKHDALAMTADELLHQMDRAGVDKALIWPKPVYDRAIEAEVAAIAKAARQHPDRFIPFGWCNPRLGDERARDLVRRSFEEYDFAGIKFNGAQDDYVIDDAEMALPYVELAIGYARPIAFHVGGDFPENTHPYRLQRIAHAHPEHPFVLIHIGGAFFPPLDRSSIEVATACPNVHMIGSAVHERAIEGAIRAVGAERVMFGSDMPFFYMHTRLAMYRELMRDMPATQQAAVLGGNVLRLVRA
jgi:uncharacterized protein